jgi:hypothetical protein
LRKSDRSRETKRLVTVGPGASDSFTSKNWPIAYFDVNAIVIVLLAVFESVCGDANAMLAVFNICCAVLGAVTVSESVEDCPFWLI